MFFENLDEKTRQELIEKTKNLSTEAVERLAAIAAEWTALADPLKDIDIEVKEAIQAFLSLLSLWVGEVDSNARDLQRAELILQMEKLDRGRDSFGVVKKYAQESELEILAMINSAAVRDLPQVEEDEALH